MRLAIKDKKIISGNKTIVMGIMNITPDSFSDGGLLFKNTEKALNYAKTMLLQGADIIDIGGESIRKGAVRISAEEELERVIPIIKRLKGEFEEIIISIDTYKSIVAKEALNAGARMINDVSGLQLDSHMIKVAASANAPIVITHMHNRLGIRSAKGNIINSTLLFFQKQIENLKKSGVSYDNIILDPGFGFCKTTTQNLEIIKNIAEFKKFNLPILLAASRKTAFGEILQKEFQSFTEYGSDERLSGTLAATAVAVLGGANIIRTHDVFETKNFLTVLDKLK